MKSFTEFLEQTMYVFYYHGTSDAVVDGIEDNGLVHHAADKTTPDEDTTGDRANSVYLTKDYAHAFGYAQSAVKKLGGSPIVKTVRVPFEFTHNLVPDEADPKSVRFRGTIPVEWVS